MANNDYRGPDGPGQNNPHIHPLTSSSMPGSVGYGNLQNGFARSASTSSTDLSKFKREQTRDPFVAPGWNSSRSSLSFPGHPHSQSRDPSPSSAPGLRAHNLAFIRHQSRDPSRDPSPNSGYSGYGRGRGQFRGRSPASFNSRDQSLSSQSQGQLSRQELEFLCSQLEEQNLDLLDKNAEMETRLEMIK